MIANILKYKKLFGIDEVHKKTIEMVDHSVEPSYSIDVSNG